MDGRAAGRMVRKAESRRRFAATRPVCPPDSPVLPASVWAGVFCGNRSPNWPRHSVAASDPSTDASFRARRRTPARSRKRRSRCTKNPDVGADAGVGGEGEVSVPGEWAPTDHRDRDDGRTPKRAWTPHSRTDTPITTRRRREATAMDAIGAIRTTGEAASLLHTPGDTRKGAEGGAATPYPALVGAGRTWGIGTQRIPAVPTGAKRVHPLADRLLLRWSPLPLGRE